MLSICLMPHPGLAMYFGHHAIKCSLNSRDNSVKSLQGVELALETELDMLKRSSCLKLSAITKASKNTEGEVEKSRKNTKNREQCFKRTHTVEAERRKYLHHIIMWIKLLNIKPGFSFWEAKDSSGPLLQVYIYSLLLSAVHFTVCQTQ